MSKEIEMTEEEAEQIIQPIFDWLASGAHGTQIDKQYCFGTISQDLALGFAQDLLETVGIDATVMQKIAKQLSPDENTRLLCSNNTIH